MSTPSSWQLLMNYVLPRTLPHLAAPYQDGLKRLAHERDQEPELGRLTERIHEETGWELVRARGEVPAREFFALLARKRFPLVYELREESTLFASAVPDQWHEVIGHLPLLFNDEISEIYQAFGMRASAAETEEKFADVAKAYWYSCEYGLIKEGDGYRMIGAGLAASPMGTYILKNPRVKIQPFTPEAMKNEVLDPYRYQDRLYFFDSLDELARRTV